MTYQEALTAGDVLARFCHTQLDRFTPGLNHSRAWTNAQRLGYTAPRLAQLCARDPLTARLLLAA